MDRCTKQVGGGDPLTSHRLTSERLKWNHLTPLPMIWVIVLLQTGSVLEFCIRFMWLITCDPTCPITSITSVCMLYERLLVLPRKQWPICRIEYIYFAVNVCVCVRERVRRPCDARPKTFIFLQWLHRVLPSFPLLGPSKETIERKANRHGRGNTHTHTLLPRVCLRVSLI